MVQTATHGLSMIISRFPKWYFKSKASRLTSWSVELLDFLECLCLKQEPRSDLLKHFCRHSFQSPQKEQAQG